MIALNAAMAVQLNEFADAVEKRMAAGEDKTKAILSEVRKLIVASKSIHFDGNGYSDEWKEEAAKRGPENGRPQPQGDRGPQRGEVGDILQEDTDRKPRIG